MSPHWSPANADLPASGVTPGTYGDATHVGQFTVDVSGRVTVAAPVAITGGGGGGAGTELDYVPITSNVTITANSDAAAQSVIDGNAVTYDGATRIQIVFAAAACNIDAGNEMLFNLYDGAADLGRIAAVGNPSGTAGDIPVAPTPTFLTPSAGAHTYHIKAWRVVNSGTMLVYAGAGGVATTRPAFYRITTA